MVIAGVRGRRWTDGRRWTAVAATAGGVSLAATAVLAGTGGVRNANTIVAVEAGLLLVPTFLAARAGRGRRGWIATALVALAGPVALLRLSPMTPELLTGVAGWALVAAAVVGAGLYLRLLDERRDRSVREARRAQRLRLAADLHDFVAHDVSEILARAQAGQVLATHDRQAAVEQLPDVEAAAQRALAALDRTVMVLDAPDGAARGSTPLPGLDELPALVERFAAAQGVSATTAVAVEPATVPREVSLTIYRVAAEALTNIRRHARHPRSVRVSVRPADPASVEVVVRDDGATPGHSGADRSGFTGGPVGGHRSAGGRGLPGLSAQVGALGGELISGPPPDGPGWRVIARLPAGQAL